MNQYSKYQTASADLHLLAMASQLIQAIFYEDRYLGLCT